MKLSKSDLTERVMADSLKRLTTEKNFDKITVADITEACGLNRQTFYYHYADKQELLYSIYDNEAFLLTKDIRLDNWNEVLRNFMKLMKRDRLFYMNTIKCSNDYFEEYLFKILQQLFIKAIEEIGEDNDLGTGEKLLLARFFSHGMCGVIIEWAMSGMKEDETIFSDTIYGLVESSKKMAYMRYAEECSNMT